MIADGEPGIKSQNSYASVVREDNSKVADHLLIISPGKHACLAAAPCHFVAQQYIIHLATR